MATNGKLEAQITVPSSGWDIELTDQSAGPTNINIPAGTYYHSSPGSEAEDLADTFATLANAAMAQTWSCSVAAGENGTGKYTISCTGSTCEVEPDLTDPTDLMGFTLVGGKLTGATSYTGASQAEGLWLPGYPFQKKNGGVGGSWKTNQQNAINSNGNVFSVFGRKYRQTRIMWPMEARAKCWVENESTANESFEQFLLDGVWGGAAWGTSTGPIRFYPDADADATFGTFSALGLEEWDPAELVEHWSEGGWRIELPHLIEVPS